MREVWVMQDVAEFLSDPQNQGYVVMSVSKEELSILTEICHRSDIAILVQPGKWSD